MTDSCPVVLSVNISPGGIPKLPVEAGRVGHAGLDGDGHDHEKHNTPVQAICMIDVEDLDDLRREGFAVHPGAVGENLTVRGLEVDDLDVGDLIVLSGGVELRLTKRRKPCYVLDAISPELKHAIAGRCGFYAEVVKGGTVRAGERIDVLRASGSAAVSPPDPA